MAPRYVYELCPPMGGSWIFDKLELIKPAMEKHFSKEDPDEHDRLESIEGPSGCMKHPENDTYWCITITRWRPGKLKGSEDYTYSEDWDIYKQEVIEDSTRGLPEEEINWEDFDDEDEEEEEK